MAVVNRVEILLDHAPLGRPFRWAVQTSLLEDAGFQPFVDHPSDNAIRELVC